MVNTLLTLPKTLSIGLTLTQPSPSDPGVEVSAPTYGRKYIDFETPSDAIDILANVATTEWPRASTLWGDIGWLIAYTPDGQFFGYGNLVSLDDGVTPVVVRIDRGDVARFRAGGIRLAGFYTPPSAYGAGRYSVGPYSRARLVMIAGLFNEAFALAGICNPGSWDTEDLPNQEPGAPGGGGGGGLPDDDFFLLEDASGVLLLEDASGMLIQES